MSVRRRGKVDESTQGERVRHSSTREASKDSMISGMIVRRSALLTSVNLLKRGALLEEDRWCEGLMRRGGS